MAFGVQQDMGADAETEARLLYDAFGYDLEEPPGAVELATRLLGFDSIYPLRPTEVNGQGQLVLSGSRWVILLSEGLSKEAHEWTIFHEVAHWWLKRTDREPRVALEMEAVCDAIAACLQAPAPAFRLSLEAHGQHFAAIAADYWATQTAMALRFGEVTREPVAVVSPSLVRVRGGAFAWPDVRLAAAAGHPSVRRVALTDQRGRAALLAA